MSTEIQRNVFVVNDVGEGNAAVNAESDLRAAALGADAYAQAEAGIDPPAWVADEAKWAEARQAADEEFGDLGYKGATYFALLVGLYRLAGGRLKYKSSTDPTVNEEQPMRHRTWTFGPDPEPCDNCDDDDELVVNDGEEQPMRHRTWSF